MPSDRLLSAPGRLGRIRGLERVAPANTDLLREHLATLDGFGLRPAIEFPIDGEIDPASLEAEDALALIDLSTGERVPMEWRWEPERSAIAGAPVRGTVLRERTRYAAVLTDAVRAGDGTRLGVAPALEDELDEAAREAIAAIGGLDAAAVAAFTTGAPTEVLVKARARLDDRSLVAAPRIAMGPLIFSSTLALDRLLGSAEKDDGGRERWGWTATGVAHAHVGAVAHGELHRTRFRRGDTGGVGPDSETFELDDTGAPRPIASEPIPVTVILPRAPAPAAGYPAVIIGHGLGASRHAVVTFAEPLTEAGFALVAIDMEGHGSRWIPGDRANNTAMIADRFTGDPDLSDGFGDRTGPLSTLDLLEGLQNLSAVRDSFRQSVLDLAQLAIALRSGAIDGLGAPLDASHLAYLGESFGSVIGGVFAAVEPEIDLFILDVAGGGVIDVIVPASPLLSVLLIPLARSVYGIEGRFDRFHPAVALAQSLIDPADPLTFAPHYFADRLNTGPRHIVILEVIDDELIANVGTDAMARAGGFEVLSPDAALSGNVAGQTAVVVPYAPATHGANWSSDTGERHYYPVRAEGEFEVLPHPISIRNPIRETFAQVLEALRTHRDGAPLVRSTLPPRADFDDDGLLDDRDPTPYGD